MKKIEYQAPEMEIIKLRVQNSVLISYSGDTPGTQDGNDGDIAD